MANTIASYTDAQIKKALLTRDFSGIGRAFEDDVITGVKVGAFAAAQNLDKVSLPAVKEVHAYAFQNAAINEIDLPWEELESIGFGAFMGSSGYPQNLVLSKLTALSNGVFAGTSSAKNTNLRTISLPLWTGSSFSEGSGFSNGNTGAFAYCTNLKKIDLGGAITKLSSAFMSNASNVTALILRGVTSVPTISSTTFNSTAVKSGTCYVYVPKSLVETFKVASYWSSYASQIRAIEDYPDICGS